MKAKHKSVLFHFVILYLHMYEGEVFFHLVIPKDESGKSGAAQPLAEQEIGNGWDRKDCFFERKDVDVFD